MAPNVTVHVFAHNDLNGSVIAEITDEDPFVKSLKINPVRDGLGSGELILARNADLTAIDADTFTAEFFCRLIISAYSDTVYYPWGFSFSKRQLTVIHKDEDGAEEFRLGGPGPKQYLDRAIFGIGSPTTGWNLDLANGDWRFGDSATVGKLISRGISQDATGDNPALPDLTYTFDADNQSNGSPWSDTDLSGSAEQYRIPIGTSILKLLWDLDDLVELNSWIDLGTVASPKYELNINEGLGDDNTGTDFGAGVCLLREGDNIVNDSLVAEGVSLQKASHVVVEGSDGKWAEAERPSFTPGDYVKRVKISYTRSKSLYWLEKAGLRWLKRQDYGEKEITVGILPGADDTAGLYFPAPDRVLWLSNLISLDSSADGSTKGHLDYQPTEEQLVTGFEIELGPAGDTSSATAKARSWNVNVILNKERQGNVSQQPNQSSAGNGNSGGNGCKCIQLCHPATGTVADNLWFFADAGDATEAFTWTGLLNNQAPGGAEGSTYYYFKSSSPTEWSNPVGPGVAGTDYRFTGYVSATTGNGFKVGFFNSSQGSGSAGNNVNLISSTTLVAGPAAGWTAYDTTITAPSGTAWICFGKVGSSVSFDRIRVYTVGTPGSDITSGTGGRAARCDHEHHVISEIDPTVDDDESVGLAVGTIWLKVDDADAPTTVTSMFILLDATDGAAVWEDITSGGGGGSVATDAIWDAKGDLAVGTGADTADNLTVGANDTILMADSSQTTGLKWAAAATTSEIADVASSEAAGTSDTYARGDHVHAHEAAHVAHDTIWAAKGDIVAATANDTAAVLAVGSNDQILMADSGQSAGLKWVGSQTPVTQAYDDTAAEGTADTYARGDHVHGMPSAGAGVASWVLDVNQDGSSFAAWTAHAGTWASNGTIIQETQAPTGIFRWASIVSLPLGFPVIMEAEVRLPTASQGTGADVRAGIVVGGLNSSPGPTGGIGAFINVGTTNKVHYETVNVAAERSVNQTVNKDQWYKIRVSIAGFVTMWLDGAFVFSGGFSQSNNKREAVALATFNAIADFRNIKLWIMRGGIPA